MSEAPEIISDHEDLEKLVIILGAVCAGLAIISIIIITITLLFVHRQTKRIRECTIVTKNMRIDVRKTLEVLENAIKKNPMVFDEDDGSERVSPIFTRRMFTPTTPLPFDLSVLRESGEFEYERGGGDRRKINPLAAQLSQQRERRLQNSHGPPAVPPRRAHSFYGDGDY